MQYREKIVDRQIGRNAELFAEAIGALSTPEERYPYLRILISVIEQARPEWNQSPTKDRQLAHLILKMSRGQVSMDEAAEVCRLRDMERGLIPIPETDAEKAAAAAAETVMTDLGETEAPAGDEPVDAAEKEQQKPKKPARTRTRHAAKRAREEAVASSDVPEEKGEEAASPAEADTKASPPANDLFSSDDPDSAT